MAALVPKVNQSFSAKDVVRNALSGLLAGLVLAPLGLLVYILISRFVVAGQALVFHHGPAIVASSITVPVPGRTGIPGANGKN